MERDEVRRAVQQGIRGLSDHHKMIIVLRDIQGMSYEQIAEALDISLGTVKSRLNRARLSLRDRLSEMELFEEMSVRTGERGDRR
jgi:RNA polymerase sigma-70 factor (ECF subfamily)